MGEVIRSTDVGFGVSHNIPTVTPEGFEVGKPIRLIAEDDGTVRWEPVG